MSSNLDRFNVDLDEMASLSDEMHLDLAMRHERDTKGIKKEYEEVAKKVEGTLRKTIRPGTRKPAPS
jgi:hypothetical protein